MTTCPSDAAVATAGCDPAEAALAFAADRHPVLPSTPRWTVTAAAATRGARASGSIRGAVSASTAPARIPRGSTPGSRSGHARTSDYAPTIFGYSTSTARPARDLASDSNISSARCRGRASSRPRARAATTFSFRSRTPSSVRIRRRVWAPPRGSMCEAALGATSSPPRPSITQARGIGWTTTL